MTGQGMKDQQARRYARYVELRDGGHRPTDAAREIGLVNIQRYERSYRQLRKIPPGRQRPGMAD